MFRVGLPGFGLGETERRAVLSHKQAEAWRLVFKDRQHGAKNDPLSAFWKIFFTSAEVSQGLEVEDINIVHLYDLMHCFLCWRSIRSNDSEG